MEWLTALELAGLPGLPGTQQNVKAKATREGWQSRPRAGRGGGLEYHISSLPQPTQLALLARALPVVADGAVVNAAALPVPSGASVAAANARQTRVMLARVQVCRLIDEAMAGGMALYGACRAFADALRQGQASPLLMRLALEANDRPRAGHVLSANALAGWHHLYAVHGDRALLPGVRQRDFAVPFWAAAFLRRYQQPQKPSVADAYALFVRDVPGNAPSIHQVRRWLAKLSPEAREQGRMGESDLKALQAYKKRTFKQLEPNDVWTADGHAFDAEISHPFFKNKVFRPEITTFADIRTRRIVGYSVELAESSTAVLDGLRHAVLNEGIPAIIYVDNGSGYKNERVEGVVERIGCTMTHAIAYNSQAKGVIERINQLWVRLAKRLPSYIGDDMDKQAKTLIHKVSRKALKAGVAHRSIIGWDVFLQMADAAVAEYNDRPHGSLEASPNDELAQFVARGWQATLSDPEALNKLMRPMESRKTARGLVQLHGHSYYHADLVDHHGDEVLVAFDVRDARAVWVYDLNLRAICTAELDGNATDYYPQSFVEQSREKRAAHAVKRLAQKIENKTGQRVAEIRLEHQTAVTLDAVLMPERELAHLRESPSVQAAWAQLAAAPEPVHWATDAVGRWQQYHEWQQREDLNEEQQRWVARYPGTEEYARTQAVYAEFDNGFNRPVAAGQ